MATGVTRRGSLASPLQLLESDTPGPSDRCAIFDLRRPRLRGGGHPPPGRTLTRRANTGGVKIYPKGIHVFHVFLGDLAKQAWSDQFDFLRRHVQRRIATTHHDDDARLPPATIAAPPRGAAPPINRTDHPGVSSSPKGLRRSSRRCSTPARSSSSAPITEANPNNDPSSSSAGSTEPSSMRSRRAQEQDRPCISRLPNGVGQGTARTGRGRAAV